ncbi:unnamed protein product [Spirodela intermedia]|uniref:Uncharacterized protein n=1 Tax=Spirodela intermedia TaxID=51605 RepID=A0A7I8ISF0_SPIIN|nr:unnamed protein product [Spirodela intermedia]CAA6660789.1 unnamed protein product [Spirodela intermedia]
MSSSKISSGDLRRPDENSPDECERTEGRHVVVTAYMAEPIPSDDHHNPLEEPRDGQMSWAINELNGDAVYSTSGNEATAGEEAPSDPTIDHMINDQNQPAIKGLADAPPSDSDGHNGQIDPTIDLEINGGDHVAVKAPQPFAVADASIVTLMTSSTLDTATLASRGTLHHHVPSLAQLAPYRRGLCEPPTRWLGLSGPSSAI